MPSRDVLNRLATVAPEADLPVDAAEEDRILARILASDRPIPRSAWRRPATLALIAVAVVAAAAVVASLEIGRSSPAAPQARGRHHVALTGPRIKLAGYHFRTPAGFTASDAACAPPASVGQPMTVLIRFSAAASADGGCVEAFLLAPGSPTAPPATPADAEPVDVGSYQGYFVSSDTTLYVELPTVNGPHTYLVLYAEGLTEDQLIAVAASGLPSESTSSNRVIR